MGGRSLGRYRLIEKLAIGGMAEVWRARQTVVEGVERDVVIKRILPQFVGDPDFVQMFLNEARVAARFNHSNIAQIYDVGELSGTYFIAMEHVAGADLGRVMRKAWSMGHWVARPLAIRIIACCCEGLAYAHTRNDEAGRPLNVVHRDVSPANILISVDGAVKLTDFGIAKASDLVSVTRAGSIKGKFAYMSPEQARGNPVDHRADLFSVALVLYELLTGVRPLRRETDAETHAAAVQGDIQPPSEVSDVPPELDGLVMKALARHPDDRYEDVHAFRMALEEFLVEQRWVATSAQIAELMRILFPDGVKPELPPGVSAHDDFAEMLGDTQARPGKSITAPARGPSRGPSLADAPPRSTEMDEARARPGPPVPDEDERDLYGEDDPLPYDGEAPPPNGAMTAPMPRTPAWGGPPRRLECLEGPDLGLTVRLNAARLVVGRVADCQIHLKDRSISRRHLELAQTDDAVMLRDLASGNGTRVNGEDVSERLLRHGDVIELGNTRFQFIDEGEEQRIADAQIAARLNASERKAPPPAEPAPLLNETAAAPEEEPIESAPALPRASPLERWRALPKRTRQIALGAGAAAGLLGVLIVLGSGERLDPKQELAQQRLAQAKAALQKGRREEAAALASAADRLWPGTDTEGVALQARRDQDAAERLRRGKLALDAFDLDAATAELTPADPVSIELVNEKKALWLRLGAARLKEQEALFAQAVREGDFATARAQMATFEGDRLTRARARIAQAEAQAQADAEARAQQERADREAVTQRQRAARAAEIEAAFRQVDFRLQALDFQRAVLAADRVLDEHPSDPEMRARGTALKRLIPGFGRTWEQARTELRNGQADRAAKSFRRARDQLREMGFGGALDETLQRQVVEASVEAGRRAFDQRRLEEAAAHYKEAARIAPKDRRVYDGLQALEARAGDLYREAQVLKATSPERASDKLRQVVAITRSGSELNGKAARTLRELNRLTADGEP